MVWEEREGGVGGEGRWCGSRGKVVWEEREGGVGAEGRWCGRRGKVVWEEREGGVGEGRGVGGDVGEEGKWCHWCERREKAVQGNAINLPPPGYNYSLPTIIRLTI